MSSNDESNQDRFFWSQSEGLLAAARAGYDERVKLSLESGASPEATAGNGNNPLYIAAAEGYLSIVKTLLLANADVAS